MAKRLNTGSPAPDLTLIDGDGQRVQLSNLWHEQKTLITFLRHFGCMFCREWLAELEAHRVELESAGVQIIAVAMGEPKHIKRYCSKLAPHLTCLTGNTEGENAYNAFGLKSGGVREFASVGAMKAGFRAVTKGNIGGQVVGNPLMMPGSFIINTDGRIAWTHYAAHVGDHPTIATILANA